MITHIVPCGDAASQPARAGGAWAGETGTSARAPTAPEQPAAVSQGRYGPVRVPLHAASRRQGAGVDPGAVPRRARPRWIRRPLLLSDPRSSGGRCRRQRLAQGNRDAGGELLALLGGARAAL